MASIRLNKETHSQVAKAIVDEHFKNEDDALYTSSHTQLDLYSTLCQRA